MNWNKEELEAIITANELISQRTSYGIRTEMPSKNSTKICWSNGSKSWYVSNRTLSEEVTLDANEVLLPIDDKLVGKIIEVLDVLPLYKYSTEAWTTGEVPREEAQLGWAVKQLERLNK